MKCTYVGVGGDCSRWDYSWKVGVHYTNYQMPYLTLEKYRTIIPKSVVESISNFEQLLGTTSVTDFDMHCTDEMFMQFTSCPVLSKFDEPCYNVFVYHFTKEKAEHMLLHVFGGQRVWTCLSKVPRNTEFDDGDELVAFPDEIADLEMLRVRRGAKRALEISNLRQCAKKHRPHELCPDPYE